MNKSIAAIAGFVGGALTGIAFGLLFAPDKGKNTREKLTYKLDKSREKLAELLDDLVDKKEVPANVAKDESEKLISETKEKAEQLFDEVEDLINKIKKQKK